ncbi:hypothetical protein PtB15_10B164 [Puccinia triticina]|nr:hypothetical protein PtB15_10B164 [Puccinia triticina]
MSRTNSRQEFLASFWIVHFSITYGAKDVWDQLASSSPEYCKGFKDQYELIEALLKKNEIINRLLANSSRFVSRDHKIFLSDKEFRRSWFQPAAQPEGEDAEILAKMQARYETLLASEDMKPWYDSPAFVSIVEDFTHPKYLMNEWLQGMEVVIDNSGGLSQSSSGHHEALKKLADMPHDSSTRHAPKKVAGGNLKFKLWHKLEDKLHRMQNLLPRRGASSRAHQ